MDAEPAESPVEAFSPASTESFGTPSAGVSTYVLLAGVSISV